jgi:hypothetical protein
MTVTVVTHKQGQAASVTITKTVSELATANSWTNAQPYSSFALDGVITVSCPEGGQNNNAKYYSSDSSWRLYKAGNSVTGGTIKVDAASGYTIQTVSFTITGGTITGLTSNTAVTVNAATWTSGVTTSNAKITSFTITYIAA